MSSSPALGVLDPGASLTSKIPEFDDARWMIVSCCSGWLEFLQPLLYCGTFHVGLCGCRTTIQEACESIESELDNGVHCIWDALSFSGRRFKKTCRHSNKQTCKANLRLGMSMRRTGDELLERASAVEADCPRDPVYQLPISITVFTRSVFSETVGSGWALWDSKTCICSRPGPSMLPAKSWRPLFM